MFRDQRFGELVVAGPGRRGAERAEQDRHLVERAEVAGRLDGPAYHVAPGVVVPQRGEDGLGEPAPAQQFLLREVGGHQGVGRLTQDRRRDLRALSDQQRERVENQIGLAAHVLGRREAAGRERYLTQVRVSG